MEKTTHLKFLILAILLFIGLAASPTITHAATLYFSPSSGRQAVDTTFSVGIYVSSADQAMNAASGIISFPRDKLEVTSLSKTGSIFTLWVQEPSFSNSAGTVNFEGIVLNPGFTGASGKAITISFRTKAAGNAPLTFSSGSVLANDGKGTNILTGLGDANFSIGVVGPGAPEIITPSEMAGTPAAPAINSPTHPDPNKWYAIKDAKFTWDISKDITGVRLLVGRISNAIPAVTYIPPIRERELTNLEDGIWYFSARLRNDAGWGAISHFRFQIDTLPPEPFSIKFVDGKETEDPRPVALFDTIDSLSGVEYYKLKIGEGDFFGVFSQVVKTNPYTLPLQAPGKRTLLVQAYDKAGNYTTASEEFIIKPLVAPIFIDVPKELTSGEILRVGGKTKYSKGEILVWFQRGNENPKSQSVKPDADGNFVAVLDEKTRDGIYKFWAEVVDGRGAKSLPSEKVTIAVKRPAFLQIGSWAVSLLSVVVPLILLILLLAYLLWHSWHKFATLQKRVKKGISEAEHALHKAFDLLKEAIREQIKMLEKTKTKRRLTEEEEKIINRLKKDLDDAEKFVRKEIEDIEKEVR